MTETVQLPIEHVRSDTQLAKAAAAMRREPAIALDTESNSFFHYPEQLCLVQVAAGATVYIVDPFALSTPAPLGGVLADPSVQKVLHGADYDVRSVHRAWGLSFANLYDTNVAARFAGILQVSLGALAETLLGVTLDKSKRLQRADWGHRPLTDEAIAYAASDVRHLLEIRDLLDDRLHALGRTAWVAEEFTRLEGVRYTPADPVLAFLGVKGGHDLGPRGLAVLRELHAFREAEALRQERPPFYIVPDAALAYLASGPDTELEKAPGLSPSNLQRYRHALEDALARGRGAAPFHRPATPRETRPTPEQATRLVKLKAWRIERGQALSLDPSLLWPMVSLERLSRKPETFDAELAAVEVRRWQREEFGAALRVVAEST